MSTSLRTLYLAVRAALSLLAPVALGSVLTFGALTALGTAEAWAGSQGFAPMCDVDATSAVAPLIAPPVESGEITICPDGTVLADFEQMLLLQGSTPAGEPEPAIGVDAPGPRVLPVVAFVTPRFVRIGQLLAWPNVGSGPGIAFARLPDRPPCS